MNFIDVLRIGVFISEFLSGIICLYIAVRNMNKLYLVFGIFLLFVFVFDLGILLLVPTHLNNSFMSVFVIIQGLCYYLYFSVAAHTFISKKLLYCIISCSLLAFLAEAYFTYSESNYYFLYSISFQSITLFLISCVLIFKIIIYTKRQTKQTLYWICIGLMLYSGGNATVDNLYNYLKANFTEAIKPVFFTYYLFSIAMYFLFIKGFSLINKK